MAEWIDKPAKSGWYWHFDGDVMKPMFVFPRPGHSYLAVYDDPNPSTGKRQFRMAEKMRGKWCEIVPPTPPTNTGGGANG